MTFSKPIGQKVVAKTEAKFLGNTEVEWEIVGWNGPLSHEIRSRASCVIDVPSDENPVSDIKLRFHLKPYHSHDELTQVFCTKRNQYVTRSSDCSCSTCSMAPLKTKAKIPLEFMPKTGTQSAGYSLLVGVLSPQDNLMISVSVEKLNGQNCTATNKVVTVEPGSTRQNLVVEKNFWRMLLWTVDQTGNIGNCTNTIADTVDDARFHLTVKAYELTSTIIEDLININATKFEDMQADLHTDSGENDVTVQKANLPSDFPDDDREVALFCHSTKFSVTRLMVKRAQLAEKSGYLRRKFAENKLENDLNVDAETFTVFQIWVTTGEIEMSSVDLAPKLCDMAVNILEMKAHDLVDFMGKLECKLVELCDNENMKNILFVAYKYNLEKLSSKIIDYIQESKTENEKRWSEISKIGLNGGIQSHKETDKTILAETSAFFPNTYENWSNAFTPLPDQPEIYDCSTNAKNDQSIYYRLPEPVGSEVNMSNVKAFRIPDEDLADILKRLGTYI